VDVRTGKQVPWAANRPWAWPISFSANGKALAMIDAVGTARVFDTTNGKELAQLANNRPVTMFLDREGKLLVTAVYGGMVRVFEVSTGKEIARIPRESGLFTVSFPPEGRYVLAWTGEYPRIDHLPLAPIELLNQACMKLDRNLTKEEWEKYLGSRPFRGVCEDLNTVLTSELEP
jgi:WD40 repeat protein